MSGAVRPPRRGSGVPRRVPIFVLTLLALEFGIWWGVTVAPPEGPPALSDIPAVLSLPAAFLLSWRFVAFFVGYAAGAVLSIVPHELGHFVAARLLGLPVLGVAFGWLTFGRTLRRPGVAGQVRVDLGRAPGARLPARVVVFALCGPAGGLVFAGAVALAAADAELPVYVRLALGGAVASAVVIQLANLVPTATRSGDLSDGAVAYCWAFRPASQLEKVRLTLAAQSFAAEIAPDATGDPALSDEEFERVRAALGDPRHQIAVVAAQRLRAWLAGCAVGIDGEAEAARTESISRFRAIAPEVETFASRSEPPLDERASTVVFVAYLLAWAQLNHNAGSPIDPGSPDVDRIARLAESGRRLRPEGQSTRNLLALARLFQDRPAEARALLLHSAAEASEPDERLASDADVIRGLAECELGDVAQARRLLESARRRTRQSVYAGWLEAEIRRRVERDRGEHAGPAEAASGNS